MDEIKIDYGGGMAFDVKARRHSMTVDLTQEKGGQDRGMNPQEVFMASLGTCIGVYVARYCRNAKIDCDRMQIALQWNLCDEKTKISEIRVGIELPRAELGRREKAVLDAARRCLIHSTILGNPSVEIALKKN